MEDSILFEIIPIPVFLFNTLVLVLRIVDILLGHDSTRNNESIRKENLLQGEGIMNEGEFK